MDNIFPMSKNDILEKVHANVISELQDLKRTHNECENKIKQLKLKLNDARSKNDNDENSMCYDQIYRSNVQLKRHLLESEKEKKDLLEQIEKLSVENEYLYRENNETNLSVVRNESDQVKVNEKTIAEFQKFKEQTEINEQIYKSKISKLEVERQNLEADLNEQKNISGNWERSIQEQRGHVKRFEDSFELNNSFSDRNFRKLEDELELEKLKTRRLEKTKSSLLKELDVLQDEIREIRQRSASTTMLSKFRNSLAISKSNLDLRNDENENLTKELKLREATIGNLNLKISSLEDDLVGLRKRNSVFLTELKEEKARLTKLDEDNYNLVVERNRLKQQLVEKNDYLEEMADERDELEDLQANNKVKYEHEISSLRLMIEEKEEELSNVKRTNSMNERLLKDDVEYLETKLEKMMSALKKEQEERANLELNMENYRSSLSKISSLESEKAKLNHEMMTLKENTKQFELDIDCLSKKLVNSNNNMLQMSGDIDSLKSSNAMKVKEMADEIEDLTSNLEIVTSDRNNLRYRLNSYCEELNELTNLNEEYQALKEADSEAIISLKNRLEHATVSIDILQQDKFNLTKTNDLLKSMSISSDASLTKLHETSSTQIGQLENTVQSLEKRIQGLESEKNQFNRSLRKLENARKDLTHQIEMAKSSEAFAKESQESCMNNLRNAKKKIMELENEIDILKSKRGRLDDSLL